MNIVDLNVLLYAVNSDGPFHHQARAWWQSIVSGDEVVGLPWVVLTGFVRLTTKSGVFPSPLSVAQATSIVDEWLALPSVLTVSPGPTHWSLLRSLLAAHGTGGNLTTDAHLAALAIEYDATLCSADSDFVRYRPHLRYFNPLTPT